MPGLPAGPAPGDGADRHAGRSRATSSSRRPSSARSSRARRRRTCPSRAQEVADEAARCREAGAAVIHLHVRNDDGSNTQSTERFAEVIDAIRRKCDCIIQPSTGGAVGMSIDERAGPLACKPEMATLNCGTINFGDDVFVNSRADIREPGREDSRGRRRRPSSSATRSGTSRRRSRSRPKGPSRAPLHFQFVLGVKGAIGAREEVVGWMRSLVPAGATWGVAAVGRSQQPMTELAMRLGGHARVGLEDNIYLAKGVLSPGQRAARRARGGLRALDRARACRPGARPQDPRARRRSRHGALEHRRKVARWSPRSRSSPTRSPPCAPTPRSGAPRGAPRRSCSRASSGASAGGATRSSAIARATR